MEEREEAGQPHRLAQPPQRGKQRHYRRRLVVVDFDPAPSEGVEEWEKQGAGDEVGGAALELLGAEPRE